MKFYNKEDLKIVYEPKDIKQPYRVTVKNELDLEILYFCKTKKEAVDAINNINILLNKKFEYKQKGE